MSVVCQRNNKQSLSGHLSATSETIILQFISTKMINVRPLTAELQEVAIRELHEKPERLGDDIAALKEWIAKQPYLRARTDDQFLVAFLRGCKFSLEKAKSKIDKYYTLRTKYPDFYTIRDVDNPRLRELIKLGIGVPLPTPLNENGPRIMLIRCGIYSADKYTFEEVMCLAHGMESLQMYEDDVSYVHGTIDILDMSHVTGAHLLQMTPTNMRKMAIFGEEALPLRQRGTHIINASAAFEKVFNLIKPLMPVKQQERLYVHGNNLETLYAHIPKKYLPKEYGGENGSLVDLVEKSEQTFLQHRDFLVEELNYGTDEKLRPPGQLVDYDDIFGVDGSFRKLNVD